MSLFTKEFLDMLEEKAKDINLPTFLITMIEDCDFEDAILTIARYLEIEPVYASKEKNLEDRLQTAEMRCHNYKAELEKSLARERTLKILVAELEAARKQFLDSNKVLFPKKPEMVWTEIRTKYTNLE